MFFSYILPWVYFMSVLAFIMFAYDKHCALCGKWRIPEWLLMVPTVVMGAFGSLCAMLFFNHKVNKKLFSVSVPLLMGVQILLSVVLITMF